MLIPLKLLHDQPLQQQLYDQLRELIVSARLASGVRMPSSRMLADQFSVSRMTVLLTYERLIAEGYLETIPAVGTFVGKPTGSSALRTDTVTAYPAPHPVPTAEDRIGQADPALFPTGRWRALIRGSLERLGTQLCPRHPAGNAVLRAAIARWLSTSRGLAVLPEQIVLAGGRQQALHIATHMLLRPGNRVVLEDPCDDTAASLYGQAQAEIVRVPIDADGLRTERLPEGPAALIHVTPEHHRPLGAALSTDRRGHLLEWVSRSGAMVLEEDSQGEFRYTATDALPLMSLDRHERVVHIGCFASALGPWLTLGYLVVPRRLIAPALAARQLIDDHALWLEEDALAELLESGAYARHVHRLRKVYLSRRDTMIGSLRRHFGGEVRLDGTHAGLHLSWRMPDGFGSSAAVAAMARHCGLQAAPLANAPTVLLGFAVPAEQLISAGVGQLAERLGTGQHALSVGAE